MAKGEEGKQMPTNSKQTNNDLKKRRGRKGGHGTETSGAATTDNSQCRATDTREQAQCLSEHACALAKGGSGCGGKKRGRVQAGARAQVYDIRREEEEIRKERGKGVVFVQARR
jgi:hypothetical protein